MSGIAMFVPNEQMLGQAQEILGQMENHHVILLKTITTSNAVNEAREAVSRGANIIVAGSAVFKGDCAANTRAFLDIFKEYDR